ncbi:MAG: TRAP transporter small permease [Rhodospirillum sp.]|nr:TRAP transporter small permease [Rhodospirillum sp.]MCF8488400.1 TRAP transporter small permease [Rhodospirillum sp.]MCF8502314.1 TRAP transporter small permease [Rhodospirillum sp.]
MRYLEKVLKPIIALSFLAMTLVTLVSTLGRMVPFMPSLYWSGELTRYLNFWITCLGIGVALYHGSHFTIGLVSEALSKRARLACEVVWQLAMLVLESVLIFYGMRLILTNFDQLSAAMELPMSYVYIAIPLCGLLMMVVTLPALLRALRGEDEAWRREAETSNGEGFTP